MTPRVIVRLHEKIQEMATQLAEKKYVTLSGLFTQLILAEVKRDAITDPNGQQLTGVRPVGRPRHTTEDKETTRLIERTEKLLAHWKNQVESGKFMAMFGDLQDKLDWAREARDLPTLKILAEGDTWEEAVDAYYEREKEDKDVDS